MEEILMITVYDETCVIYRGHGIYRDGPEYFNALISASSVAESLKIATKSTEIETYNARFIAERTPDEWNWPDIIETVLEYRKMCKHCKEAPQYPENCEGCKALNPYL